MCFCVFVIVRGIRVFIGSQVGSVGAAIPNAFEDTKTDRGPAKVWNIDPEVLAHFNTWDKMRREQHRRLNAKASRLVRNLDAGVFEDLVMQAMVDPLTMQDLAQNFIACILA